MEVHDTTSDSSDNGELGISRRRARQTSQSSSSSSSFRKVKDRHLQVDLGEEEEELVGVYKEAVKQYKPLFVEEEEEVDRKLKETLFGKLVSDDKQKRSHRLPQLYDVLSNIEEQDDEKRHGSLKSCRPFNGNTPKILWKFFFKTKPDTRTWDKIPENEREIMLKFIRSGCPCPQTKHIPRYLSYPLNEPPDSASKTKIKGLSPPPSPPFPERIILNPHDKIVSSSSYDPEDNVKLREASSSKRAELPWNLMCTRGTVIHAGLPVDFSLSLLDSIEFMGLWTSLMSLIGGKSIIPSSDSLEREMFPLGLHYLSMKQVSLASAQNLTYHLLPTNNRSRFVHRPEDCVRLVAKFSIDPSFKTKREERETRRKERSIRRISKALEKRRRDTRELYSDSQSLEDYDKHYYKETEEAKRLYETRQANSYGAVQGEYKGYHAIHDQSYIPKSDRDFFARSISVKPKPDTANLVKASYPETHDHFRMRRDGTSTLDGFDPSDSDDDESENSEDEEGSDIEQIINNGLTKECKTLIIDNGIMLDKSGAFNFFSPTTLSWIAERQDEQNENSADKTKHGKGTADSKSGFSDPPHTYRYPPFGLIQDPLMHFMIMETAIQQGLGKIDQFMRFNLLDDAEIQAGAKREIHKLMKSYTSYVRLPNKYTMVDCSFRQFLDTHLRVLVIMKPKTLMKQTPTITTNAPKKIYVVDHFLFYIAGVN